MSLNDNSIFLIAEIGVNWNGDFSLAEKMISESKKCGFDAVKFQAFNDSIIGNHPEKKRLLETSISSKNIDNINDLSKLFDIEWFCTPMYLEAVDLLQPYVKKFKIREFDGKKLLKNEDSSIFDKILKTGHDVIVSSNTNPRNCKYYDHEKIKWLYCVPQYPCPFNNLDFRNLCYFNGYSNHTPGLTAPFTAAVLGAKIIEIHVTIDKKGNYFDNNVSLDFNESKMLIDCLKQLQQITI